MKAAEVARAMGSETRRRLLSLLADRSLSAVEAYRLFQSRYKGSARRRETVYRELEQLTRLGMLDKHYDAVQKALIYALKSKKLAIEVRTGDVTCL